MEEQKARLEDQRARLEAELREQFRDELYKNRSSGKTDSHRGKRSLGNYIILKIVSKNQFSGKTYFYTIASRRDITALRDEMAEVNRKTSPPPQQVSVPQAVAKRRDSGEMVRQMEVMKDALKADFEEQIKVLES